MLAPTGRYAIRPRTAAQPEASDLWCDGAPTATVVPGVVLEAQFVLADGGGLLLLTFDVPYEEALSICLLDPADRLAEQVTLGVAYATGVLRDVRLLSSDTLGFGFFAGAAYRLRIASRPRWRVPLLMDPPGAWRLRFRRRLLLTR